MAGCQWWSAKLGLSTLWSSLGYLFQINWIVPMIKTGVSTLVIYRIGICRSFHINSNFHHIFTHKKGSNYFDHLWSMAILESCQRGGHVTCGLQITVSWSSHAMGIYGNLWVNQLTMAYFKLVQHICIIQFQTSIDENLSLDAIYNPHTYASSIPYHWAWYPPYNWGYYCDDLLSHEKNWVQIKYIEP